MTEQLPPPPPAAPTPPPPAPPQGDSERTLMLVLSYLGLLAIIPLLVRKDDREVRWHSFNGLSWFVGWFIIAIVLWIVEYAVRSGCFLGAALSAIHCILWLGYLGLIIMGIMKAVKGERLRLPVLSDFADKM